MKREAAHHEQGGVDRGQQQLQLVNRPGGQGIDRPEGEIGGEEPGEGHAVGHQEGGQAEHPEVGMLPVFRPVRWAMGLNAGLDLLGTRVHGGGLGSHGVASRGRP